MERTYTTDKRLQTRRDALSAHQRRPVHVVPAVRARREHVLVGDVDRGHGHVVRFGKLANVPAASVPSSLPLMLRSASFDFFSASRAAHLLAVWFQALPSTTPLPEDATIDRLRVQAQ